MKSVMFVFTFKVSANLNLSHCFIKLNFMNTISIKSFFAAAIACGMLLSSASTWSAEPFSAPTQTKVDAYKKKLTDWAANPAIVAAVKEVNTKGGLVGMTNAKWNDLDDKDVVVKGFETSKAGLLIKKWEEDASINKLVLRDEKGNLVAANSKPLIYNNSARPLFVNTMKGQAWAANEIKPDPTTGIKSVQVGAPVMDGGKVIGVIHAGITAE